MGECARERILTIQLATMRIILIGAGNLMTSLAPALHKAGHEILQVYSRTERSAAVLAASVGCEAVTEVRDVRDDADVYIFSVSDRALSELADRVCHGRDGKLFLHTAGSIPMDVFRDKTSRYGVLYPMQTFSRNKVVDFSGIPCFVEGCDAATEAEIHGLATSLSSRVYALSSEARRYLHLSAVFACNFVNRCYAISASLLERHGIPFDVMLPLIDETARKVHVMSPADAQTGPAVRYDRNVIDAQLSLQADTPDLQDIYRLMSDSIHKAATTVDR